MENWINYQPPRHFHFQISVKFGGVDIPGSPFAMTSNPDLDDVTAFEKNGTGLQRKKLSSSSGHGDGDGDGDDDGKG